MANPYDLNLRHLRLLVAIDQSGSVSEVARAASISQPALTQALSGLERKFGIILFQRSAAGVVTTPAGEPIILRIHARLRSLGAGMPGPSAKCAAGVSLENYLTMVHVRGLTALVENKGFSQCGGGHRDLATILA